MATKYYGINDKWTDDDIENVIEVASEDGTVNSVMVNGEEYGGGGGDPETVNIKIKNNSSHDVLFSTIINYNNNLTASRLVSHNSNETFRVVLLLSDMPFTFKTMDGGSISSTSTFGTVTFNSAYDGTVNQGDTITITSA